MLFHMYDIMQQIFILFFFIRRSTKLSRSPVLMTLNFKRSKHTSAPLSLCLLLSLLCASPASIMNSSAECVISSHKLIYWAVCCLLPPYVHIKLDYRPSLINWDEIIPRHRRVPPLVSLSLSSASRVATKWMFFLTARVCWSHRMAHIQPAGNDDMIESENHAWSI